MSWIRVSRVEATTRAQCPSGTAVRALAKIRTHLRPRYPEEAQMLAEMNVPIAESTIAEQMSRQDEAIARCARAQAMREVERARRDSVRLQQQMRQAASEMNLPPMAISTITPDVEARIQAQMAGMAARMASNNIKLQIAADKIRQSTMRLPDIEVPVVEVTDDGGGRVTTHVHVRTHARCNVNRTPATPEPPPAPEVQ
jgi:seryl-tRNA synthetase